ncbi:hypothetical protein Z517_09277 [Fonsecaea pedrosoi CBS 271.37]|uniref:3'-5' exonuclease domain-containing protein n=1 Tax=Fonsecaea pedrosoi CBS 271.37 TaxID=1442368 RepID=A0A0D2G816_9EURO|nr:uncharacterized protein Z517_09277 [Fonsecaea pedrosoi CBS 271.37]KIW76833.1 hypothetical protein Z517_09277 [Fonsecaea pedrosoi CBS 271.37]
MSDDSPADAIQGAAAWLRAILKSIDENGKWSYRNFDVDVDVEIPVARARVLPPWHRVVDNEAKHPALLTLITKRMRTEQDQLMFVDLEGVNRSRSQARLPLCSCRCRPAQSFTNLVDSPPAQGKGIRPHHATVFFDIRNDSDALHARFGVYVAGIIDLPVMGYATRNPRGKNVNGLAKCIERDLPPTSQAGRSPSSPATSLCTRGRREGSMKSSLKRPMADKILKYCHRSKT